MKPEPIRSDREVLAGFVERVTYHNEENGFCVLRIKARGQRELITVVGYAAVISAGEWVTASGEWVNDRTHGQQFRARFLKTSAPTSIEGIEKYLGSGMIRGVGPAYAKKLVRAFGDLGADLRRHHKILWAIARLTPRRSLCGSLSLYYFEVSQCWPAKARGPARSSATCGRRRFRSD